MADTRHDLTVGGDARFYLIHVPPNLTGPAPLLMAFHGSGVMAAAFAAQRGFDAMADQYGFIAVYPQGLETRWNDGREDYQDAPDDLAFVAAMVKDVAARHPVDEARIYATGMSNGASFVQTLACLGSVPLAGIASVSGTITSSVLPKCKPRAPLAVLLINGTADPIMPYDGGEVIFLGYHAGSVTSVDETMDFWIRNNGCSGVSAPAELPPVHPEEPTRISRRTGLGCGNTPVVAYAVIGGAHNWPGANARATHQMDATTTIVDFFFKKQGAAQDNPVGGAVNWLRQIFQHS